MRLSTVIFLIHPKPNLLLIADSVHKVQSILNKQVIRRWSKKSKHSHADKSVSTVANQGQSILNQHFTILWLIVLSHCLVSWVRDMIPQHHCCSRKQQSQQADCLPVGPPGAAGQPLCKRQKPQHMQKARSPQTSPKILSHAPLNRYCHFQLYCIRIWILLSPALVWILASRILCCGSNRQIHTDYRNPVEKKGRHGHSLSERGWEGQREPKRESGPLPGQAFIAFLGTLHPGWSSFTMHRFTVGDYL